MSDPAVTPISAPATNGAAPPDHTAMPIVRIAVFGSGRITELALPAELPLREIIPAVRRIVGGSDETAEAAVQLSLAPVGGAPFILEATLDTVGVVDGDLLALQPVPAGPPAPRLVEDIADAAMIFSEARERPWGVEHIRRAATVAVMGFIVIATAAAGLHRFVTGTPYGVFAVSAVAVAAVLGALLSRGASARLSTALAVAALPPIAAAFALAVPGDFGSAQVLLAAAGVAAWSIISVTLGDRGIAVFTAAAATSLAVSVTAAATALWTLAPVSVGCGLILLALLITVQAAQLSALCARLPVPVIPAPGDPTPSALPLQLLEDLPRRIRVGDSHQTGFIAAGVLLAVTGSVAVLWPAILGDGVGGGTDDGAVSPWAWYLVVAGAAAAALRARVWDSAPCKAWLLAHPYLVTTVLLVAFAAAGHYSAMWWSLAVLAALVAVWVTVALNPAVAKPDSYSLPMRRVTGFAASALDASAIPVMAYLVGLFAWALNGF